MKLVVNPQPVLSVFSEDLDLVILIRSGTPPELLLREGMPKPDRHLLLGLLQRVCIEVEEADTDSVVFAEDSNIQVERSSGKISVGPGLVIARSTSGPIGVLATVTPSAARRLARQGLRWFTGAVRLDVP